MQKSQNNKKVVVAACDTFRAAAVEQLSIWAERIGVQIVKQKSGSDPAAVAFDACEAAAARAADFLILDTAGRLHIDDEMMRELEGIKKKIQPHEILFIADGMTGQDAVNTAQEFLARLDFDGIVLTKLDGDTRGGAALSMRAVTQKPIKFVGIGEKMDAVESFYPDRMASRILGKGDIVSFVEKAQETVDVEQAAKLEKKLLKDSFTLEDFYDQLQQVKKMGPLDQLLGMIPGIGAQMKNVSVDDHALVRIEAIINSMTLQERRNPKLLNGSRRKRIAVGSGTQVQDVNRLLNQFGQMKHMMKRMRKMPFKGLGKIPFAMG